MRINLFVAKSTGMSRRSADKAIGAGRVTVNGRQAESGQTVEPAGKGDKVSLDGRRLSLPTETLTIMLNKPTGYVCSRNGQGSPTVYELLPPELHNLKPVGRLDKDSSGLLLLTNDGDLANRLTHPRYAKEKIYEVRLDRPLSEADTRQIRSGVQLDDGTSRLRIKDHGQGRLTITMSEGRNRQIRRTFAALGYKVTGLHRIKFGPYELGTCPRGEHRIIYMNGK